MVLKNPGAQMHSPDTDYDYQIIPRIDQSKLYIKVWKHLGEGGCIGIFPEGSSHDQPDMMPLKAGVALMALGTTANYNQ